MFYKIVEGTDFDALEGSMLMTTKQIIAVTSADTPKDAMAIFNFMKAKGVIHFSNNVEIEQATREEFEDFIKN